MQIVDVRLRTVTPAKPEVVTSKVNGEKYYCFTHGEAGRGRWQYRLPISSRQFPVVTDTQPDLSNVSLVDLKKVDSKGNRLFIIASADADKDDGAYLVLLHLSPGYRGGASYTVKGNAEVLGEGYEAQGDAGNMGGASCPVVLVTGPCELTWSRSGRLYNSPSDWVARFDGETWSVGDVDQCGIEEAALNY